MEWAIPSWYWNYESFIEVVCLISADLHVQFATAAFIMRGYFCDPQRAHLSLLRWLSEISNKAKFTEGVLVLHRLSLFFNNDTVLVKNIIKKIDSTSIKYDGYKRLYPYVRDWYELYFLLICILFSNSLLYILFKHCNMLLHAILFIKKINWEN